MSQGMKKTVLFLTAYGGNCWKVRDTVYVVNIANGH